MHAYLRHRLRCPSLRTHRLDAQLAPHELCSQPLLPLFQLIDIVGITSIIAGCHKFSPDIAGHFRKDVLPRTLCPSMPMSKPSIWQAMIIIVCPQATDTRLKDLSEAARA